METWWVKSDVSCPLCGEKMRLMSGSAYYNHDLGVVELSCRECNLEIHEYGLGYGFEDGQANTYWKLAHALMERVKKGGKRND